MSGGADTLVFEAGGRLYGLSTASVEAVVEAARPYFLPGGGGLVRGVISFKGVTVAVIDAVAALAGAAAKGQGPLRVVVVRDGRSLVGIDVTGARLFFLWKQELKEAEPSTEAPFPKEAAVAEKLGDRTVEYLEPAALVDEAARLLSR